MLQLRNINRTVSLYDIMTNLFYILSFHESNEKSYTNRQSSPFHVFHWWRAYHVRLRKLDCLPRISTI